MQNILPGLRELRAPLSAGYVWLFGLWVLLGHAFGARNPSGTVYGQVVALSTWAGRPATLLGISFVAYLLGVLSGSLTSLVNRGLFRILRGARDVKLVRILAPPYRDEERFNELIRDILHARMVRRYETDSGFKARVLGHWRRAVYMSQKYGHKLIGTSFAGLTDDAIERRAEENVSVRASLVFTIVDVEGHLSHGRDEVRYVRYRLAGREDQIYNEFDRIWSEAEFRLGLALPSLFLSVSLAIADSPLWLVGVMFSVAISYIAAKCFSDAERFLYSMVASGRVPLEGVDQLRSDQILMVPYDRLLANESPEGKRNASEISLSDNEFQREMFEDEEASSKSDPR